MTRSYKGVLDPFARGLGQLLGLIEDPVVRNQVVRPALEEAAKRSPIQDAMNQAGAIRMGVRELPEVPRRAPKPEFGPGSATRQPEMMFEGDAPVPQLRPTGATGTYTVRRGDPMPAVRQDVPPAPRTAERFETENQLRIPYTQPGKGGQMYSPKRSSETPEVVGDMMRQRLGDKGKLGGKTAEDLGPIRGSEGQRAMDLNPEETRRIMQAMSPASLDAPLIPDTMRPRGIQMADLSGINPRDIAALVGAGTAGVVLGNMGNNMESVEEGAAVGAVGPTSGESAAESLTPEEAAALNEYMSNILTSSGQNPGALNDIIRRNAPRSPETYQNPLEYQEDVARFVAGLQSGQFRDMAAALEAEQSGAILDPEAPGIREQTSEQVTTGSVGSALGNDNAMNAVGQAEAAGDNARIAGMQGTLEGAAEAQKNNEIIDATRPIVSSELSRTQNFLREAAGILNNQAEIQRRMRAEADPRNAEYIAARNALGPNPTREEVANVERIGREAFYKNFPQFR